MPTATTGQVPYGGAPFTRIFARKSPRIDGMTACDICGGQFERKTSSQLRCSRKCASVASNARKRADTGLKRCRTCTNDLPVGSFALAHRSCLGCEELRSTGRKKCNRCSQVKPRTDFHGRPGREDDRDSICKSCKAAHSKVKNATPVKREMNREAKYRARYGISTADVEAMHRSQDGRCAICRCESPSSALHVDHDHATGAVRALLCRGCNALLGQCSERIETLQSAITYLERHRK